METTTMSPTAYSYEAYLELTEELLAEGKTSGPDQSERMVEYTRLNLHRMKRIDKSLELLPEVREAFQNHSSPQRWVLISEPWCGDAAQNVPVIAALTALSPNIELEILLRDQNLELMDQFLTNGGRAVPKLIVKNESGEILGTWGPRPEPAQEMVRAYKAMEVKPSYDEFVVELQKWYAKDRTETLQRELVQFLQGI